MSVSNNPKYTSAEYNNLLKQYDVNNDGKIDRSDLDQLHAENRGLAALSFVPFAFIGTAPKMAANARKMGEIEKLLDKQADRTIDSSDVKNTSSAYPKPHTCPSKETSGTGSSDKSKSGSVADFQAMREAHNADLQKAAGVPWKCDDMARELVLKHPDKLNNMSLQDKAFLLQLLRDAGSGKFACVNADDQKAILSLLKSAKNPDELRKMLDIAGGVEAFEKHMKGDNLKEFQKLTSGLKTPSSGSSNAGSSTNASDANKSTSGTNGSNSTNSTNSSGSSNATNNSSKSDTGKTYDTKTPDATSQKPGMEGMYEDFRNASAKVGDLWDLRRNLKKGDTFNGKKIETDDDLKDAKQEIMMKIQDAQQWKMELNQFITNYMKKQHEMAMAVIRNMG